jgi:hypothetical protein
MTRMCAMTRREPWLPLARRVWRDQMGETAIQGSKNARDPAVLEVEVDEAQLILEAAVEHGATVALQHPPLRGHHVPEVPCEAVMAAHHDGARVLVADRVVQFQHLAQAGHERRHARAGRANHRHDVGAKGHGWSSRL